MSLSRRRRGRSDAQEGRRSTGIDSARRDSGGVVEDQRRRPWVLEARAAGATGTSCSRREGVSTGPGSRAPRPGHGEREEHGGARRRGRPRRQRPARPPIVSEGPRWYPCGGSGARRPRSRAEAKSRPGPEVARADLVATRLPSSPSLAPLPSRARECGQRRRGPCDDAAAVGTRRPAVEWAKVSSEGAGE